MELGAIGTHFESLKDPQVERTRRHKLRDVAVLSVMAVVGFAEGWSDVVQFAKDREPWLPTVLELPSGIPSDDTFRREISAVDPVAFQSCFLNWFRALMAAAEGKLVAIDGKTGRRSYAKKRRKVPSRGQCLGSPQPAGSGASRHRPESNEVTAIVELLAMRELSGATVSIGAMGRQKRIAESVRVTSARMRRPRTENTHGWCARCRSADQVLRDSKS